MALLSTEVEKIATTPKNFILTPFLSFAQTFVGTKTAIHMQAVVGIHACNVGWVNIACEAGGGGAVQGRGVPWASRGDKVGMSKR